jgi:monoamine oxidase
MDADAVVIGAGAAGLAAARSLAARSLNVVLLEARDRVGGRVWSRKFPGTEDRAELGAEFIHGPAETTMRLLREAGSGAVATSDESWLRGEDGELRRENEDFAAVAGAVLGQAGSLAADESVERFLQRFEPDEALRESVAMARAFVEGFEAADPAVASVRAIADELRSGTDSTSARPVGGYARLFEYLRATCLDSGVRLFLDAAVRRVSWHRGKVAVEHADRDGGSHTIRARTAVITLPAGVLRAGRNGSSVASDVTFHPELPAAKLSALDCIQMGHVVRVVLGFRSPFWEQLHDGRYRDAAFFRDGKRPFAAYWTQVPARSRLIVAWAGAPGAGVLRGVAESETIDRAVEGFGALFDATALARTELEWSAVHDWDGDPFAQGAYSYVSVGGGNARAALAAPVDDTLFFAGEATSFDGQGGTVSGALETGERAAEEVATALGAPSQKGRVRG